MTNTYLATSVGVPLQVMPFSGARAPRSDEIPASAGGRNLTLAMPPEWTHVKNGPVPNCLRSLGFTKGDKDNAWDLDLRDGNTEENNEYAANLCAGCPILTQCLSAAMEEEGTLVARNRYLIRGGLTPAARYELAQEQRKECSHGHVGEMRINSRNEWVCLACNRISAKGSYQRKRRVAA